MILASSSSSKNAGRILRSASNSFATSAYFDSRSSSGEYCQDLVRRVDRDAFLTSYFYPRNLQETYFAVRAFNIEIATVKDQVSNSALGRIRMQWWRDTISSVSKSSPPQHPVALALYDTVQRVNIPLYHFRRMVDGRDQDFDNAHHMTMESLRAYSESTSSTMFYILIPLLVQSHGPNSSQPSTFLHAASHLGLAHTITTLIRSLPYHASKRHMPIPTEITAKHDVSHEDIFRYGGNGKGISNAVFEFACIAKEELDIARTIFAEGNAVGNKDLNVKVPGEVLPVFLSGVPIASYLKRLENVDFDAFHHSLQLQDWKLPLQIWRSRRRHQF